MSWEIMPLSAFLTEREGRIKHTEANDLGLRRVTKIDFSGQIHLDQSTDTKTDMIRVCPGDLLISGINAAKGAISVHEEEEDVLATIHYSAYRYDPERISVDFLKWFFKSPEFIDLLKQQVSGGIKTELKSKHILPLRLRMPKLREQKSIAERLNGIQREQVKLEREIAHQENLVAKLKQAILQEAITGRLTAGWRAAQTDIEPASQLLARIRTEKARLVAAKKLRHEKPLPPIPESEIPFEIPMSWSWQRIADLAYVGTGATPAREKKAYYENGQIPWITSSATGSPFVHEAEELITELALSETNCSIYPKHTLLVAMYGQGKTRGQVTELLIEAATNQACAAIVTPPQFCVTKDFIKLSFQESYHRIRELAQGGSQPNLNLSKIKESLIPLPPLVEQTEIVARVEALMERCRELEAEIARSRAHAAALLQAVLREAFSPASVAPNVSVAPPAPTPPVPVATPPRKKHNRHFARAVLSAEIVHQLHGEPTFGRVKHQKIFHLCEHMARIEEIAGQYHREAAGPLDNKLIYANEGELKKQQWYREVPRDNAHGHAYIALPKAGAHEKYLAGFDEKQVGVIHRLIDLMRKWDTDRCEIFCTAYAAWNDLLLWNREPTEDAILHEILEHWNPAKRRFPRERWQAALKWMREHNFAPTGFGKPTAKA